MPSRVRTLFKRKETFRATPATPSGRAVGSSCSTRLDQRLNSCGVKPSKFIFEFIPIPPLFWGRFQYCAHLERGGRGNPALAMLFQAALFLIVGSAKDQNPRAKSCSSLIRSTSSDDDQMQRATGDCRRIGTRRKL